MNERKESKKGKPEVKKYQRELVLLENGEQGRSCSKCGELKLVKEFNKDKRRKIGYISKCKECIRIERGVTKRCRKGPVILENGLKGKYCTKCQKEKTFEDFYNDKRAKDGKKSWCKECSNALYKKKGNGRVSRYPLIKKNGIEGKICTKCDVFTPKEYLGKDQKILDGYRSTCRKCINSQKYNWNNKNKENVVRIRKKYYRHNKNRIMLKKKKWYLNNIDHSIEYRKTWYGKNKYRLIQLMKLYSKKRRTMQHKLQFDFTNNDEKDLRKYYKNCCALTESVNVDIDHFIPVAWGHGGTYRANLLLLDSKLNRSKQDKNPFEWIKEHPEIDRGLWDKLIIRLSSENNMSVSEFEKFVYYCENNKQFQEILN